MIRDRYGHYHGEWFIEDNKTKTFTKKDVSFSRDFRGRYLNDTLCAALCSGNTVALHNLIGRNGEPYAILVKLHEMINSFGDKYISVEKSGYIPNNPYQAKAADTHAVTIKQVADTVFDLLDDIYSAIIDDDDMEVTSYLDWLYDELSKNILSIPAMREYPESITVDKAIEITQNIICNIANGIVDTKADIYKMLRENKIDYVTIDFEDDEPALANGTVAAKPDRTSKRNYFVNQYHGEWNGRPIAFNREYYGTYVDDALCEKLCKGNTVLLQIDDQRTENIKLVEKNINGFMKIVIQKI